jgi:signal transduction histidine kinase
MSRIPSLASMAYRITILLLFMVSGALGMILLLRAGASVATAASWLLAYSTFGVLWFRLICVVDKLDAPRVAQTIGLKWQIVATAMAFGFVSGGLPLFFAVFGLSQFWLPALMQSILTATAIAGFNVSNPAASIWFARACLLLNAIACAMLHGTSQLMYAVYILLAWMIAEVLVMRAALVWNRLQTLFGRYDNSRTELRLAAMRAADLQASKVRVLGTVSHELRQPVHALGMMVERLKVEAHSPGIRMQLDQVDTVVRSLAQSLSLLLDITRLDAGSVKVKMSTVGIQALMERLKREFGSDAHRKGLRLSLETNRSLKLYTDHVLLYGILANFLSNAIRYTDRGDVKVFTSPKGNDAIWIHVRDSGRGIPRAKLNEVFDEYVRLDHENQSAQGFGLGLAIARRTADLLGLTIEVDSTPEVGSEFRVSASLSTRLDSLTATMTVMPRPSSVGRSLVGFRVVLVENDEAVLRGIDCIARSWGCIPLLCQSVEELAGKLSQMEGVDFHCIVADYHLGAGRANGLDAIELMRKKMGKFVAATIFTGDLAVRFGVLRVKDVHVAHKPVVPARIRVMFEEMAAETKRRREAEAFNPNERAADETVVAQLLSSTQA